jgi:hypothetical protein
MSIQSEYREKTSNNFHMQRFMFKKKNVHDAKKEEKEMN